MSLDLTAPAPNTYTTIGRVGNRIVWDDGPGRADPGVRRRGRVQHRHRQGDGHEADRPADDRPPGRAVSPGFTPEPGEIPEVEIVGSLLGNRGDSIDVLGTGANDAFYAGDGGFGGLSAYIGLNGDYDADVMMQKPRCSPCRG